MAYKVLGPIGHKPCTLPGAKLLYWWFRCISAPHPLLADSMCTLLSYLYYDCLAYICDHSEQANHS